MNIQMKRLAPLVSLALASLTTACGGGGGSNPGPPPPPPPGAKFSNASLAGQYAFSMTGTESCGGQGSFFGRAGTFTADGNGNITTGLEDVNVCTGVATIPFTGGRYSVGADGRGVVALTNSTGTTNYSITLSTATAGSITQTDVAVHLGMDRSFLSDLERGKREPCLRTLEVIAQGFDLTLPQLLSRI